MRKVMSNPRETGSILLTAVIITLTITVVVAALVTTSLQQAKAANFSMDHAEAMALAEGVTETAQKRLLDSVANFVEPDLEGTVTLGEVDYEYTAEPVGDMITRVALDGVTMVVQPYVINSEISVDKGTANISRIVDLTMTPVFQYMILFDDDLEILPGPSMTLGGRVHSNGSIFVGCGGTLTVDTDYFRCTGDILRERKNNGSTTGGDVDIKVYDESNYVNMQDDMDSSADDWIEMALDEWGGTVQDGAHGVSEVSVPEIGSIKAFDEDGNKGYYHENAGLVIVDDTAYDTDGNIITLPPGTISEVDMYDGRENKTITVTQVDMELLNGSGYFPDNGLLYAYRTDASSSQPNGIRLSNGKEVHAPLTVVTEDPLFIQGDFNTEDKKGVAVIADAVNLLSNAWDDSKTSGSLPDADDTWYNLAMITGNVPTPDGGGDYSGGFENLPRFHEDWGGKKASIRGSFIKIYESEIAVSEWEYGGDAYKAPIRDWLFDEDLNDISNMPPFTPNAVYFRRVTWDDNVATPFLSYETEGESPSN